MVAELAGFNEALAVRKLQDQVFCTAAAIVVFPAKVHSSCESTLVWLQEQVALFGSMSPASPLKNNATPPMVSWKVRAGEPRSRRKRHQRCRRRRTCSEDRSKFHASHSSTAWPAARLRLVTRDLGGCPRGGRQDGDRWCHTEPRDSVRAGCALLRSGNPRLL